MAIEKSKIYLCSLENQDFGARLYDIAMIQNLGINCRLNFSYNKAEVLSTLLNKNIINIKQNDKQSL